MAYKSENQPFFRVSKTGQALEQTGCRINSTHISIRGCQIDDIGPRATSILARRGVQCVNLKCYSAALSSYVVNLMIF